MTTSCVKNYGGVPMLFVNDRPINPMAYITYFTEKNMYREFAENGYKLYSVPVYFAEQTINESSRLPPFQKGIFDKIYSGGDPDYTIFDYLVGQIREHCPDAMIFPRVNVSVPYDWEEAHPEDCCEFSFTEHHRYSFWSDAWLDETERLLKMFVEYVESAHYRDNIIGYQISAGSTEEWFPMDFRGSKGVRADEKFREYCLEKFGRETGTEAEYNKALSERIAYSIIRLSKLTKEVSALRVAVGAFYGYTFEVAEGHRGHSALREALESEYIDFLCSPNSYYKLRCPGIDHPYMLPIDSLKKAGKLYLAENDTRTHLSEPPNDLPRYQSPIWRGPEREITLEIMKMHFAKALCHGTGMWWFDMWGGWYRDEKYMELMNRMRCIYGDSVGKSLASKCEVAMFFDENTVPNMIDTNQTNYYLMSQAREPLGLMRAPYDMFLADDFDDVADKYKAIILVQSIKTDLSDGIIEKAKKKGIPLFVITSMDTAAEELHKFCEDCGVHMYCNKKAVIYSNESYVFIHTGEDDEFDFGFDGKNTFTDLYTGETVSFPVRLPPGKSFLFKR